MEFQLNSGLDLYVVGSSIQKSIRRSDVKQALYFSRELHIEGHDNYIWKRLVMCAIEDVGLANIDIMAELYGLHQSYLQINTIKKVGKKLGWFNISKAIVLLCNSMKNHAAYDALFFVENTNSPLEIKGKANILSQYNKNVLDRDELAALNTMYNYMQKHRIKGIFDKMLEFSLVNCSNKVSNFIQYSQLFYTQLLNKKKYQMPFVALITLVLVRASRQDKTINQYARESIKGQYSFSVPKYAIDQTVGAVRNKESDKLEKEVVYKHDAIYRKFKISKY
jgi:hypothetical protein